MSSSEASFHGYLRREVDNAAKRYERARKKVFALTATPEIEPGSALLDATEALSRAMQVYLNALRRVAHYAAHKARPVTEEQFATQA